MANEIKFRSGMPRIANLDTGDAFLISRADGTAGYTLLSDAVELRGAPFTYDKFTPSQLAALKGETGAAFTYDDLTTAQKAELAAMVGIDHSLLTEQIVPGEFAYNKNQQRSQVYVRSFIATTTTDSDYTQLPLTLPHSGCVISAWGSVMGGTIWAYPITAASIIRYVSASNSYGFTHTYSLSNGAANTIPARATVYLTIKYTK